MKKFFILCLMAFVMCVNANSQQRFENNISIISYSTPISFSHNGETMELEVKYNNSNDIKFRIKYESPQEINTIYFWLNERIGLKQNYIYVECVNGDSGYINITEEHYKKIAYNLHSISIGNKWKLISKNKSYIIREYFVGQQISYYVKHYQQYKKETEQTLSKIQKENERLEGIIKNLEISNQYYQKELKSLREKYDKYTNNSVTTTSSYKSSPSYTYERTTESERVYPPRDSNGKPRYKYKYKYYRNGKWRYRY